MATDESTTMKDVRRKREPVVLVVLDGWGIGANRSGNAIFQAAPATFTRLWNEYPHQVLQAVSPAEIGNGRSGSSETGHASIGTGRMIHSDISDISMAITSGSFFESPALTQVAQYVASERVALHLVGLVSNGGNHSHIDHLYGLLEFARRNSISHVYVHAITDGVDVSEGSASATLESLEAMMHSAGVGTLASVSGRDTAMDRSGNFKKTDLAYRAMIGKQSPTAASLQSLIEISEAQGETDATITPTVLTDATGKPRGVVQPRDAVILFNSRPDRMTQLLKRFADPHQTVSAGLFKKPTYVGPMVFTLTDYHSDLPAVHPLFRAGIVRDSLGQILSDHGIAQARIASSDREAHVTYFLNGGRAEPFSNEERILIDARANLRQLVMKTLPVIRGRKHPFIVVNLDSVDKAAHTGNFDQTVAAAKSVDLALDSIVSATLAVGGIVLITADHGNGEGMLGKHGGHRHTVNGVPWIYVDDSARRRTSGINRQLVAPTGVPDPRATLADVAPTILALFGIAKPTTMTGRSLVSVDQ